MLNYFHITGYGVNKRGLTIGINYRIASSNMREAKAHAMNKAQYEGLTSVRITRVISPATLITASHAGDMEVSA
ncbi:hypothetical protein JBO44_04865 [Enterobacter asburiae]|uniref:hypothetical protein n=1 Tax=Enterobacter asburiae TaxID=61645 RepID=UPI00192AB783|nr:hypothetical protein [Enterobacter asburiae]MBL5942674.1 hypothetical protein [Enterobacter asburiae]MBL5951311.1 hypothetical protein [Enterobacter asburiae]